jgi:hypothetical protein
MSEGNLYEGIGLAPDKPGKIPGMWIIGDITSRYKSS